MILINDLSKKFGDLTAVDSLNFKVNKGEIFGIVGPDGAGKSTLLRMISSILLPDKGTIFVNGSDLHKDTFEIKKKIAYMPQKFGMYEDLSVEENIFFFGKLYGLRNKAIKKQLKMLYEFSQLEPFKNRLAGKLSGGMKQKLGLACCLVHKPEILILDEPTNGVDPVSRREFWKILYDLLADGVTIIVSTAYLDEAERCNRLALMHQGEFIRTGTPQAIKDSITKKLLSISIQKPIEAEEILKSNKSISGIIRSGNTLKIFVENEKKITQIIKKSLSEKNIKIDSIASIIPSLEDCFVEIISGEA